MNTERTPWFDGTIKPERPGMYERLTLSLDGSVCYSRWDGQVWLRNSKNIDIAAQRTSEHPSHSQELPWRGLAEEPK